MRHGDLLVDKSVATVPFREPNTTFFVGIIVEDLCLCGSSPHFCRNIAGLPRYNSAQVIPTDLSRQRGHLDAATGRPTSSRFAQL